MRGCWIGVISATAAAQAAAQIQFDAPRFHETSRQPTIVVATDVDEDGHLDFVTADFGSSRLSHFHGDGNGRASFFGSVEGLVRPEGLVALDFDADGHIDLATTISSSDDTGRVRSAAVFLRGDGAGGFSPLGGVSLIGQALSLLGGDADGDGYLDLVATTLSAVNVLRGDGTGLLAPAQVLAMGGSASCLADFDENGSLDLVTVGRGGALMVSDGAGGFVPQSTFAIAGGFARDVIAADLDEDGHLDLAVADPFAGAEWFRGDGRGTFESRGVSGTGGVAHRILATDLNGDRHLDLAIGNTNPTHTACVMIGDGTGQFGAPVSVEIGDRPATGLAVGDFDEDCRPDLAVVAMPFEGPGANRAAGSLVLLQNRSPSPAACLGLSRIAPATGNEQGGDLVSIFGVGLTGGDVSGVRFGDAVATVLAVTPDRVVVRTPPGAGSASVLVAMRVGDLVVPGTFTWVAAERVARYGNVGVGLGDREDVLLVNAFAGAPETRDVIVAARREISVAMLTPSSRAHARFALYAWPGAPNAMTLRAQPAGIGTMTFPTPLDVGARPQPIAIGNNLDPRLGSATFRTSPAPSLVGRLSRGVRSPIVVTLQGFIQDDAAATPQQVSITNAIILQIVP